MSGGTRSYEMARRMVERGHEVTVITSDRSVESTSGKIRTTEEAGFKVIWIPVKYHNSFSKSARIIAFLKFVLLASWHARKVVADVVFATSTPLTIIIPAVVSARSNRNVPLVFEVRDLWPEMPIAMGAIKLKPTIAIARWLEKWAYKNSSAVVALSPMMKDGVLKTGFDPARVAVIPNSCDVGPFRDDKTNESSIQFRNERDWLKSNPLILYAGTLGAVNAVENIAVLAAEIRQSNPSLRFLVVGDGVMKDEIERQAHELGVLNETFFMESRLPKASMPAAFNAATMVCNFAKDVPEFRANSANKFFDGLAASKPMLINYGGWQYDLLNASGAGLAVWQKSPAESAQMLSDLLNNEERLESMSQNSARLADKYFDRDLLASQLIQVIESAHQGKSELAASISPGDYS